MNTLQDLRSTLDAHAAEVTDSATADRVAAVTTRARVVRRRRAAGVAAAAALAVGAVGVLSLLPGGGDAGPAEVHDDAPVTMTSLGWDYRLYGVVQDDGDRVATELDASDSPRLVSWATTGGEQQVVVRREGAETWASDAVDHGDFVWVPPGYSGTVTVAGPDGLELALYELNQASSPDGVGEGVSTLREDVAGRDLAGAGIGAPGQASIEVPVEAERGMLSLAYTCAGLPDGYVVQIGVAGEPGWFSSGGDCAESGFDPGGSPNIGIPGSWGPGAALRMRVARQGEAVVDGEFPDLRLSLGAYALEEEPLRVAGNGFARLVEYGGKVFEVVDSVSSDDANARLPVPAEGDFLVDSWVVTSGSASYSYGVTGTSADESVIRGLDSSGTGPVLVEPDADEVALRFRLGGQAVEQAALVLYRRVQ